MAQINKTICIFGGSGFIGSAICQNLARAGYRIKIATRIPESVYALKLYGNVGQIVPFQCDYSDDVSIQSAIEGCDVVINLIGILFEKRRRKFMHVHCDLPVSIAKICTEKNVKTFIHFSALGVDKSHSKYAASKFEGEKQILGVYPKATILRPSVVFGSGDSFFNLFAKMAAFLPFLPLIGGGKTKFQPVYVGDVAQAVSTIVVSKGAEHAGKTYQLVGPEVVTFKEIYQTLLKETNRKRRLVYVPWMIAKIQGFVMGFMPKPLLTCDQVTSLKTDNIQDEGAYGLPQLGIEPTAMRTILPHYLSNFRKGGPFAYKKEMNTKTA